MNKARREFIKSAAHAGLYLPVYFAQDRKSRRGAGGVVQSGSTLLTGLQGFWKLSDTSDSSGNGNTLTNNGSATFTTGKIGNAVSLNGSTQFLHIADNASLSTGDISFSAAGWANASSLTGLHTIASKWGGSSSDNEWRVQIEDGVLKTDIQNASGPAIVLDELDVSVGDNDWFMWVFTYNAATDTASLTVNNETGNTASVGSIPGPPNGTGAFAIGAQEDSGDLPFAGLIDALGFWKKVLTGTEQTEYWNSSAGLELN